MLKRFYVDNFRNLINVTIEPSQLNLVLGENNSGKTSFMHALALLRDTASLSLNDAIGAVGTVGSLRNVYLEKNSLKLACTAAITIDVTEYEFSYELEILLPSTSALLPHNFVPEVKSEILRVTGGAFKSTALLSSDGAQANLLHERRFLDSRPEEDPIVRTRAPADSTMLQKLYELETNRLANTFKKYLLSWRFYAIDVSALRLMKGGEFETVLQINGSNLAPVLYTIKSTNERLYRFILQAAKAIEPRLEILNFFKVGPDTVIMVPEDAKGKRFDPVSISSGTLRFLAIATVLIPLANLPPQQPYLPLVFIEEPENGIYVQLLKGLMDAAKHSQAQLVFSTHSPYFIDLFDANLTGLHVFKRGDTHSTVVKPDPAKITSLLADLSLGEQHFRGLLRE